MVILAIVGGLLILLGVLIFASGAGLIEIPGTDFFAMLGKLFGFLEKEVWLAGKETREWFCEKDLQDAIKLCQISPSQLEEYCSATDEEKLGICQDPPKGMKGFCKESWSRREKICESQNEFNSACGEILKRQFYPSMKDMPFCK